MCTKNCPNNTRYGSCGHAIQTADNKRNVNKRARQQKQRQL